MQCPVDGTTLTMSDRQGIEIDYCPTCRGIWLDRGELDKLIEREQRWVDERVAEDRKATTKDARKDEAKPKKKKVTSFLQDIMEMGQG
jgi:Zn-finger nucleic acid-binding protein